MHIRSNLKSGNEELNINTCKARVENVNNSPVVDYARQLVRRESVTPNDAGCQLWIADKLSQLGASVEHFQSEGVSNMIAVIEHGEGPDLAFCGHTDVVPPGQPDKWLTPPFAADIVDGMLIGRGVADMKGGIAAALAATEKLVQDNCLNGRLWFLITSDEEGEAEYGSREIVKRLLQKGVTLDYCLVGEPTSQHICGDMLKVGRRGALSFDLKLQGKTGHVAYPGAGVNAIHLANQVIDKLLTYNWGSGNQHHPGTSIQLTHIDSGKWSDNVIPDQLSLSFNIRYTRCYDQPGLIEIVKNLVTQVTQDFQLESYRHCQPYYSQKQHPNAVCMLETCQSVIEHHTGQQAKVSSSGGTSDGRFFSQVCSQIIELGVTNGSIHQENERVHLNELETLYNLYTSIFKRLMGQYNKPVIKSALCATDWV